MLKVEDLTYQYPKSDKKLFEHVNLEFDAGELYAIVGRSGAGKTTFLSLLAGLDVPTSGKLKYQEQMVTASTLSEYRRKDVSMVFQAYNLFDYMTVMENILTAMELTGSKNRHDRQYVLQLLAKIGIDRQLADKKVVFLSGGQQQRVAIVRTMCCDAQLVLADEPTGNLDEDNTTEVINLFKKLAHEENRCVIIVTHEAEVARNCDVQIELHQGHFSVQRNLCRSSK
ncbi:ABC transporter ATP-binding protein [Liquorilactobacillus vini]|uniref:Peptide ABC transporter ATPase n=1 Tax=Liquorilactobacillus vini DSM 20605 TaxID=1133569 RepID=A0A0R2CAS2_9LACO|nr:ABC transporter ATP-binding protein [Liquorilactobacillus vini]KRM88474.1 peptide ABC transporter ATPase [Liquorilactobacillus vini DSM 20605]